MSLSPEQMKAMAADLKANLVERIAYLNSKQDAGGYIVMVGSVGVEFLDGGKVGPCFAVEKATRFQCIRAAHEKAGIVGNGNGERGRVVYIGDALKESLANAQAALDAINERQ